MRIRASVKKPRRPLGQLPRRVLLIDETARLAAQALAFSEGVERLVLAAEAVEEPPLLQ